jgi:hypothetical protein
MEKLKLLMRGALKLVKWLLITLAAVIALFVVVNSVDEKLRPEVAAALEGPKINAPAAAENGFFAFAGLNAPAGRDAHAWGQEWVSRMSAAVTEADVKAARDALGKELGFAGDNKALCQFTHAAPFCLPHAGKHAGDLRKLAADNAELLSRYEAMLAYPQAVDTYLVRSFHAPFSGRSHIQVMRLRLSLLMLDLQPGRLDSVLEAIERDVAFQRRLLRHAQSLVSKMMATSGIQRNYWALSEILRTHAQAARDHRARIERILLALAPEDLMLMPTLMTEFRFVSEEVRRTELRDIFWKDGTDILAAPMEGFARLLFNRNATINMEFDLINAHQALDGLAGKQYVQAEAAFAQDLAPKFSWAYNPVGKFLISIAMPDFRQYMRRLHNLDGYRRLVALQWRILASGSDGASIPKLIEQAGLDGQDPFTGLPMQWDAQGRQLFFITKGSSQLHGKDGRVSVTL